MNNVGTIIELARDGAIIMANDCDFVLIRRRKGMFLGQQVKFTDVDIKKPTSPTAKTISGIAGIAAVFVIVFSLFFQSMYNNPLKDAYAFVDIDINPSLELLVDKDNKVLGVKAINYDAKELVKGIKPYGKPVGEVCKQLLKSAEDKEYISFKAHNIILVSIAQNPDYEKKGEAEDNDKDKEQNLGQLINEIKSSISFEDHISVSAKFVKVSPDIKKLADQNGMSIGRQYIYEKSREQNIELDINDAKNGDLGYILGEVKITYDEVEETFNKKEPKATEDTYGEPTPTPNAGLSPDPTVTPTATVIPTPTVIPTTTPTTTPTPKPTPTVTIKPTPTKYIKPTPTKTPASSIVSEDYARISGKADGGRIVLNWQRPVRTEGFKYYKVVASRSNVRPKYPEDGNLYAITDINNTSAVVDNSHKYNGGDFGPYFNKGEKYYFSVTTVYEDKKVPGDVIVLTYPGESPSTNVSTTLKPKVTGVVKDGKIVLSWDPIKVEGFTYYKIVISKSNPSPKYPEDGYLYYFTDPNKTSAAININDGYNGGDFGGHLVPGQKYYFSVTLVYSGNKIPGNAVHIMVP